MVVQWCTKVAVPTGNVCKQPQKIGPCRSAIPRWYFDAAKAKCKSFSWGGCQPNGNNFMSKRACREACSGIKLAVCILCVFGSMLDRTSLGMAMLKQNKTSEMYWLIVCGGRLTVGMLVSLGRWHYINQILWSCSKYDCCGSDVFFHILYVFWPVFILHSETSMCHFWNPVLWGSHVLLTLPRDGTWDMRENMHIAGLGQPMGIASCSMELLIYRY